MLIELIAKQLLLSRDYVGRLAATASYRYKEFTIPKRSGGVRVICHPAKPLKALQRWLQGNIIRDLPVHSAAAAYRTGKNIADHALRHVGSRYLLRLDCERFFESISAADVALYLHDHLDRLPAGWEETDTDTFVKLVCRHGELTIGAVTSPGLSNALCYELDATLSARCFEREVSYTRYADDLFFSTSVPNVLAEIPALVDVTLRAIKYPESLKVNAAKTRHSSMKGRRRVTGLTLTSQGTVSLGRQFKRRLRGEIHRLEALTPAERSRLAGLLSYVKSVEPGLFNRLVLKYGSRVAEAARPKP